MEPFSVPRWPDNFPLAGAIYIEYLAKRGHYITPQDSLEALDRNKHPRSGHMLERYQGKIKWLDQHSSNYKMSRHTMDAITSGGDIDLKYNPRTENLSDLIQSVRDAINVYIDFWLKYRSPISEHGPKHRQTCIAQHTEKTGGNGGTHSSRTHGCAESAAEADEWEIVGESGEEEWTEVTVETIAKR